MWSLLVPGAAVSDYAMVGAAAFLAVTLDGPVTAIVLVLEFTHTGPALLAPAVLAVAGAILSSRLLRRIRPGAG